MTHFAPVSRSSRLPRAGQAAWILVAGLALVGLGVVAGAQIDGPTSPNASQAAMTGAFGTADSNRRMIAVTGHDVTGGSLLFLVDTEARQLAVYTAQGGTQSTSEVRFVGARRIDLDLQVDGYNDKSKYSFKDLEEEFEKAADPNGAPKPKRRRGNRPELPANPRPERPGGN